MITACYYRVLPRRGFSVILIVWTVLALLPTPAGVASGLTPLGTYLSSKKLPLSPPTVTVRSLESFLADQLCASSNRQPRIARALAASAAKHNVDPSVLAAVAVVESRCDTFAISGRDSVGIMQIHLPTWAPIVERQGIDVFNVEDNVDFGAWILGGYVRRHGLRTGLARYRGAIDTPESNESAAAYADRVLHLSSLIATND